MITILEPTVNEFRASLVGTSPDASDFFPGPWPCAVGVPPNGFGSKQWTVKLLVFLWFPFEQQPQKGHQEKARQARGFMLSHTHPAKPNQLRLGPLLSVTCSEAPGTMTIERGFGELNRFLPEAMTAHPKPISPR